MATLETDQNQSPSQRPVVVVRRRSRARWVPYAVLTTLVLAAFALGWGLRGLMGDDPERGSRFPIVIAEDRFEYDESIDPDAIEDPPVMEPPPVRGTNGEPEGAREEADTFFANRQFQSALAAYEELLDDMPGDRLAMLGRARSLVGLGRSEEGAEAFWQVLDAYPDDSETALELMALYRSLGQHRSVVAAGRASLASAPDRGDVEYWVGRAYRELGDHAQAESYLRAAIAHGPRGTRPETALIEMGISP